MSNLLTSADAVRHSGRLVAPAGKGRVAMIDPHDVAAAAATVLVTDGHDGQTYTLTGGQAVSWDDVAAALAAATGQPVEFIDVPDEAARQGLVEAGLPGWLVAHIVGAFGCIRRGELEPTTETVRALTGHSPRAVAEFARDHAQAFTAPPAAAPGVAVRSPAAEPQDLERLFAERLNAGDLDGLVALYEPDALLEFPPGTVAQGPEAIRELLGGLLAGRPTITLTPIGVLRRGDLALTWAAWTLRATAPDGRPFTASGRSAEVVRRQPDGAWLVVLDEPDTVPQPGDG
jgi:uncharacterized protein (TIGR02246 family)